MVVEERVIARGVDLAESGGNDELAKLHGGEKRADGAAVDHAADAAPRIIRLT
jgi:hypothetical protein